MADGFCWNLVDVDKKTAAITVELKKITEHTEKFKNNNNIYRQKLKDKISEEVGECITKIQTDSNKILSDVTEINARIHEANNIAGDVENKNSIHV